MIHQQSLVRDRGLRVSPALCWWALSGIHLPEHWNAVARNWHVCRPHDPLEPVGQTHAGRGARHSSPRPPPPQRAGRLRSWPPAVPSVMIHSPTDPFMAMQFRLHRIALASERGPDQRRSPSTPLLSRKISTATAATKVRRLATPSAGSSNLTLARHRPSLAKNGPAGETWPVVKRGQPSDRPRLPAHETATLFSKLSVHVGVTP